MTPAPLEVFLTTFAAMLDGRVSASELEATLGPSASGTARLERYVTLVGRQRRGVIDEFYAATRVASEALGRPFGPLRDAYLVAHPPSHWAPARAAEHFPAFLEALGAQPMLIELADFAWTRHCVLHAAAADDGADLAVRHYTHAVAEFTHDVERGARSTGAPDAVAQTWLLGRSRSTSGLVAMKPSLTALVALQLLAESGRSEGLPVVAPADVRSEVDHLREQGLLSAVAVASLRSWL